MSKYIFITAGLLAISAPSLAQIVIQDNPSAAPTKKPAAKSDLDKLECRSEDTIGSRLESHRVCMTKQQWLSAEQEAKDKIRQLQITGFAVSH